MATRLSLKPPYTTLRVSQVLVEKPEHGTTVSKTVAVVRSDVAGITKQDQFLWTSCRAIQRELVWQARILPAEDCKKWLTESCGLARRLDI